jgi:hypothetical protein
MMQFSYLGSSNEERVQRCRRLATTIRYMAEDRVTVSNKFRKQVTQKAEPAMFGKGEVEFGHEV